MVRPNTNWEPNSFIAWATALRTTGSPTRLTRLRMVEPSLSASTGANSLPVTNNAHVEELMRDELECPRWLDQSPACTLSSINASMVALSGTRSRASAIHISATPSFVLKPYSPRNFSIMVGLEWLRTWRTKSAACADIFSRVSAAKSNLVNKASMHRCSSVK